MTEKCEDDCPFCDEEMNDMNTLPEKYAVVRDVEFDNQKKFTLWHDTLEKAKAEAERLCRKENVRFCVVKLVGMCEVDMAPVKWTE